ncbi:unnamed protein product [Musa acuminata subsp. burmannicoides]
MRKQRNQCTWSNKNFSCIWRNSREKDPIQGIQIRLICHKMREIMINQTTTCDLKGLMQKFTPEMIGKEIEKASTSIFPLQNVYIRKVKILKANLWRSVVTTRRMSASRRYPDGR